MGKFCNQCNRPVGWFSRKRVKRADGTEITLCRPCARRLTQRPRELGEAAETGSRGDEEARLRELEAARRADPNSLATLEALGTLSLSLAKGAQDTQRSEHLKRAGNCFRSMLLHRLERPTQANVFAGLAEVCLLEGDRKKGEAMLQRALAREPDHKRARQLLTEGAGADVFVEPRT